MVSQEKAVIINANIQSLDCKIVYPPQNLVDLIWKNKPGKSDAPVFKQKTEFKGAFLANVRRFFYSNIISGQGTRQKLEKVRNWIREQRPSQPSSAKGAPRQAHQQVGTLISFLPCIGKSFSE